jgi:hypothetical protein
VDGLASIWQGEKKKMIMKLKEQLADAQHVRNA